MRARNAIATAGFLLLGLAGTIAVWKQPPNPRAQRVYRIGFGNDSPLHYPGPDGEPSGLAVEVIKEAARRSGIPLQWVRTTDGYREIMQGRVDMHVLITALPERSQFVHLVRPYLSTETCFLVKTGSRYQHMSDLADTPIAVNKLPILQDTLHSLLPHSKPMLLDSTMDAVKALDEDRASAAYVDQFAAIRALLDGSAHSPLRIIPSNIPPRLLTLASSFETKDAADEIRDQIQLLSEQGELRPILARWSLFPALMAESAHALDVERVKVKVLAAGALSLLLLLLVVAWLLWHLRHRTYALRVSEVRYRNVVESLGDGVATLDREGRFLLTNPAAEGVLGAHGGTLAGRKLTEFLCSESGEPTQLPELKENDKVCFQAVVARPDGTRRKVRVTVTPQFRRGLRTGAIVVLGDITGARELEEQLRLLAQALRCADDCISITDSQDRFVYVNDAFLHTYGYEPHELLGQHVTFVRSSRNKENLSALDTQEHWRGELWNRTKDGRDFLISLATARVRDEEGAAVGMIGAARDITALKRVEEERRSLQTQLIQAQKLEALGRLAGGVAHDFNNLLTVIIGYTELLLKNENPLTANRKRLEQIRQAGKRAADLTQQLLAFGRKQLVQAKLLNLNEMVLETREMLHRLLPENIEIQTSLDPCLDLILADPSQIHQVLLNLALNARDAMTGGGKLTLETTNTAVDEHFTAIHPELLPGNYVRLRLSDTGIGMNETICANIFEPFFTTKGLGEGTGLGLATVYGIIRQSGGTIWVESEPGLGSTFEIYLPASSSTSLPAVNAEPAAQHAEGKETILLVEDQNEVRVFVREVLEEQGYRVLEAVAGKPALDLASRHSGPLHVLLTDVVMPGISGRELAKQLLEFHPETKILYMSGYTQDVFTETGHHDQPIAFLQKPLEQEPLLRKLREMLTAPN